MQVRFIPTKVHGAIDYVTAPTLVAAPELFRMNGARASTISPRVAGFGAGLYSALTDYELGIRRVIPMRAHLALDALAGSVLALAPWVFGSARRGARQWLPHAIVGVSEAALALTTKTEEPQKGARRVWTTLSSMPRARAIAIAAPIVLLGTAAVLGKRRALRAVAFAADAVEEVADTVEDAAEDLGDAARGKAGDE